MTVLEFLNYNRQNNFTSHDIDAMDKVGMNKDAIQTELIQLEGKGLVEVKARRGLFAYQITLAGIRKLEA